MQKKVLSTKIAEFEILEFQARVVIWVTPMPSGLGRILTHLFWFNSIPLDFARGDGALTGRENVTPSEVEGYRTLTESTLAVTPSEVEGYRTLTESTLAVTPSEVEGPHLN